jgi:membrane protease YdiL (CAAX protease family)
MITDDEINEADELPNKIQSYPNVTQAILLSLRFILYSVVLGFFIAMVPGRFHIAHTKNMNAMLALISYIAAILATIWVGFVKFRKYSGTTLRLKFNKAPAITIIVAVLMILTMPVLTDPLSILIPMSDVWKKIFADMMDNSVFTLIAVIVAAPILEEIFFRGIILNGLLKNYSPQTSIVISAAIFGIIHLNPWQAIPAFLGGLIMGWMYWKTNSIIPGMILHFANNLFSTLLGLAFPNIDTLKQLMSTPVYIALFLASAAILMGGWVFLEKYFEDNPTPENDEEFEPGLEVITEE